jgi:hypothetical protein
MTATATATATATLRMAEKYLSHGERREMAVEVKGEIVPFETYLSDDIAQDVLKFVNGRFARSLWEQSHNRGLSPKQLCWAHKLSMDYLLTRENAPAENSEFASLFAAFEAAKSKGAKRLTLRFAGVNVKPSRDGASLWVTSQTETEEGRYGLQPKYLGKITSSGMDSRIPDEVKAVLEEAAKDPLTAAIRYGKLSGSCSCCGRTLTDPESVERGIGPICATKFGW